MWLLYQEELDYKDRRCYPILESGEIQQYTAGLSKSKELPMTTEKEVPSLAERLQLILDEKNHRLQEMHEYNRRLDRIVLIYLTAVYSAIGLKAAGKISLADLDTLPEYTMLAFLFVFLNLCLILHAISQSAWSMSLARYVHVHIMKDLKDLFMSRGTSVPRSVTDWDDWENDSKGAANQSRTTVTILWILLIEISSVASLALVQVHEFFISYPLTAWLSLIALVAIHLIVVYIGVWYALAIGSFHEQIKPTAHVNDNQGRKHSILGSLQARQDMVPLIASAIVTAVVVCLAVYISLKW